MKRSMTLALSVAVVLGVSNLYADSIYCVHDAGLNDSQFCKSGNGVPNADPSSPTSAELEDDNTLGNFAEDTPTPPLELMGPLYQNCDIEALDIMYDPGEIYAASGDDTPRPGHLYWVERVSGDVVDLGDIDATKDGKSYELLEIDGISFDPDDGVLWGWAQGEGLFKIDNVPLPPMTSSVLPIVDKDHPICLPPTRDHVILADMVLPTPDPIEIEDIEWNEDGEVLYGVENVHTSDHDVDDHGPVDYEDGVRLWAYHQSTEEIKLVCTLNFSIPVATAESVLPLTVPVLEGEIEGLDSLPRSFFDLDQGTDALVLTFHDRTLLSFAVITTPGPTDPPGECGIESYGTLTDNPFNDIEGIAYGPTILY